jgi:hypothetical protein
VIDMKAAVGDWLLVKGRTTGQQARRGKIVAVGVDGAPPFTVRWVDDDHLAIVVPGPDASVVDAARLAELDRVQAERVASVQNSIRQHMSSASER